MRATAAGTGDQNIITRDQRAQLYTALPASGKQAQTVFSFWALGVPGIKSEHVDAIVAHPRVQSELRESAFDRVSFVRAAERAATELGHHNVYDALRQPSEKAILIAALRE